MTGAPYQILNRNVESEDTYEVKQHLWLELANSLELHALLESGDLVMNDGSEDLAPKVGKSHAESINGVVRNHSDITLLPAVTANAPEVVKISNASIGFKLSEGDEIFGQSRINNYAGGDVEVQLHLAVDNDVADRWVQYEVHYIVTNGRNDKSMNSVNGVLQLGPTQVPTVPWRIFEGAATIPSSEFDNGEVYLFMGIQRVAAVGKTEPTNDPAILRYCKRYWEKLES